MIDYKNDIHNCATYNFTGPKDTIKHAFYDVLPYYLYYTVPDVYNPYLKDLDTIGFWVDNNLGVASIYALCKFLSGDLLKFTGTENETKYNQNTDATEKREKLIERIPKQCIK
mgnify:CR=1 FL=1